MKCIRCGFEAEQEYAYCPGCGAEQAPAAPVNAAAARILPALKDNLFLIVCTLMTVSCGLNLYISGPNVLTILFTIFLWLTYAKARKDVADANHLRCISGTVYAQYIITNVCAILVIALGVLCAILMGALMSSQDVIAALTQELEGLLPADVTPIVSNLFVSGLSVLVFLVLVFAGAAMLVFNIFSTRYIHRFAKSVYKSIETGTLELQHANAAYGWLWAFGIFSGISALSALSETNILGFLANGASCAAPIISAILIKKYLTATPAIEA